MQVSLQSLTITDCGSIFAEADFAALAELSLIQKLHIQTDVQVRPQAISQLSCLTLLNSLSLTVESGDRLNPLNYHEFSGFPHAVVSLKKIFGILTWPIIKQRQVPQSCQERVNGLQHVINVCNATCNLALHATVPPLHSIRLAVLQIYTNCL